MSSMSQSRWAQPFKKLVGFLKWAGLGILGVALLPAAAAADDADRWDGERWHAMGGGVNGDVKALAVMGNDLCIGGQFDRASGKPASNFARWRLE